MEYTDQAQQYFLHNAVSRLCLDLQKQLEDCFIEGLKRKGFEFNSKIELENFVKTRCRRTDNIHLKEHVYYVDNIAFFLHKYETICEPITQENNGNKMSANYGSYTYL